MSLPEQNTLIAALQAQIQMWQGIEMPHETARAFAADLAGLIAAFQKMPPVAFDARPCDFRVALEDMADEI